MFYHLYVLERKEGESCGGCLCPPTMTMGTCEENLECMYRPNLVDAPGQCAKKGKAKLKLNARPNNIS